jgi:hypothetical protein
MAKEPGARRSQAEEWFERTQATNAEARKVVDSDLTAARKKTAKLKAQRLAKEAAEGKTVLDKKPPSIKRRMKSK